MTPKQQVLKVYPGAWSRTFYEVWVVYAWLDGDLKKLGDSLNSPRAAWADAVRRLKEQK